MEELFIKAQDGLELSAIYSPVENPKALVQIIHGMVEHKERYLYIINKLNEAGYTTIITDSRGHGESINEKYPHGHIESIDELVSDQYEVTKFIKEKNPNKDLYIFSHSFGTCISRNYIMKHDDEIKKLIISGTVASNPGAPLGAHIAKKKMKKDKYQDSKLLFAFSNNLSTKEDFSWLSYNKENISNYENDPLCRIKFDVSGYYTLFTSVKNFKNIKLFECKNKDLKILSISGKDDRTTFGTKGVKKSLKLLNKAGYTNTSFIEYKGMKHEILMEDNKELVAKDIIEFFNE